jgi:hypothetical protein
MAKLHINLFFLLKKQAKNAKMKNLSLHLLLNNLANMAKMANLPLFLINGFI